jgi:hypothetical protein
MTGQTETACGWGPEMTKSKPAPASPAVTVRERVDVTMPRDEVERALLDWLAKGHPGVPAPADRDQVFVTVSCDIDTGQISEATLSYEPAPRGDTAN